MAAKKAAKTKASDTRAFEAQLWEACEAQRGSVNASRYKHPVLGLPDRRPAGYRSPRPAAMCRCAVLYPLLICVDAGAVRRGEPTSRVAEQVVSSQMNSSNHVRDDRD